MKRPFSLLRSLACLLMASGLATLSALAQADDAAAPKIPDGPLLRPAPDYSQWVVTFTYPEDRPKKIDATAPGKTDQINARPRTLVTTKTGDTTHEEYTDVIGRPTEKWFAGQTEYYRRLNDPVWYEDKVEFNGAAFSPPPANGFRDFDGVSEGSYVGEIKYQDRDCLIFIPGADKGTKISQESDLNSVDNVLIVDAQSRLPVEARASGIVRTFEFETPPTSKLRLPDDLLTQLAKAEEITRRILARPERPY